MFVFCFIMNEMILKDLFEVLKVYKNYRVYNVIELKDEVVCLVKFVLIKMMELF